MLRLMANKRELGFKLETTPYTAETLASTDYDYRVYNVEIKKDPENYERREARNDYSRDVSIQGKRKAVVTFSVDMYPGSAASTAPKYFDMIRACGWKQTTHGATGVSVAPHADYNRVPATIEVVYPEEGTVPRSIVYKVAGAMGKVTIAPDMVGQPIKLNFEFTGRLESITTRSYATQIIATGFDTALPPAMLAATFSLFGTWQFPNKWSIESNEAVELFSDISTASGYDGARVVDRDVTGSADPDMVVLDDLDLNASQINNTTGQLAVTLGGNPRLYISAPVVQITDGYNPEEREGHIANQLKLGFRRSIGNDEVEILQGSKT